MKIKYLLFFLVVASTNVYSKGRVAPWDWYKNNPTFAKEYNKLTKDHPVKKEWLRKLNGVGSPVKKISLDGTQYDYGYSCKPHDCADNQIHVLYNPKKSLIYAIYGLYNKGSFLGENYSENIKRKLIELSRLKINNKVKSSSNFDKWTNKKKSRLGDLAKLFVLSFSKANLESLDKISSKEIQKSYKHLTNKCNVEYNKSISKEAFQILKDHKGRLRDYIQEGFKQENIEKIIADKYPDADTMPKEKQNDIFKEVFSLAQSKVIKPSVEKLFLSEKIKTDKPKLIKEILVKVQTSLLSNVKLRTKEGTRKEIIRITNKVMILEKSMTLECVNKHSSYGYIRSVNIIEVKESSPDIGTVRMELVSNKDTSTKVVIGIEKIKGNWKIVSF